MVCSDAQTNSNVAHDGLTTRSYWVCEKSDGVRVLMLIVAVGPAQEVYLVCDLTSCPLTLLIHLFI